MIPQDFIGTLPGWITAFSTTTGVVAIIIAFWRRQVALRGLANSDAADIRDHYAEEVKEMREGVLNLRQQLRECEEECLRKLETADAKIKRLDQELWGEKRQRVAEQISLINVIVASVDAPELNAILKTLESVQMAMRLEREVGNGK